MADGGIPFFDYTGSSENLAADISIALQNTVPYPSVTTSGSLVTTVSSRRNSAIQCASVSPSRRYSLLEPLYQRNISDNKFIQQEQQIASLQVELKAVEEKLAAAEKQLEHNTSVTSKLLQELKDENLQVKYLQQFLESSKKCHIYACALAATLGGILGYLAGKKTA